MIRPICYKFDFPCLWLTENNEDLSMFLLPGGQVKLSCVVVDVYYSIKGEP